MVTVGELSRHGRTVAAHRPWPRGIVDAPTWHAIAETLAAGQATLLGFWGEPQAVHAALLDETAGAIGVATFECPDGRFPSLAALHPPAGRLERAIRHRFGLGPGGAPAVRPRPDQRRWGGERPAST